MLYNLIKVLLLALLMLNGIVFVVTTKLDKLLNSLEIANDNKIKINLHKNTKLLSSANYFFTWLSIALSILFWIIIKYS